MIQTSWLKSQLTTIKGSDQMLLDLAEAALKKAGLPLDILTGRNAFPIKDSIVKKEAETHKL